MLRVLTSQRWLGALAVALAFAVAAFFLGRWQWHRYEEKSARADRIHAHYAAPPRPVAEVLGPQPVPLAREWTRVTMTGRYAVTDTLLVRNRPHDGVYGYEVVVPFTESSGAGTVLVDRGWVPNAPTAEARPEVPTAPGEQVTVTGWVRQSEPSLGRRAPPGQLASINLGEAAQRVGTPLLGGYVILGSERTAGGTSPPRPKPLDPPDTDLGPHQAYAFQWWFAMLAGFVLVWLGARRDYLEGRETAHGDGPDTTGTGPPRRPARKVRIWDEEDG